MKTYCTLYTNERRAVEVTIRDQADAEWTPTSAYAKVVNSTGTTVVEEAAAMVSSNKIYTIITSTVTASAGNYEIIWRILKTEGDQTYTYYHKTALTVEEL